MNRRTLLKAGLKTGLDAALVAPLIAACSVLPQHPYVERREWPLAASRPTTVPPRPGGRALLVRTLRTGPGLEARGLQVLQPDGSVRVAEYEEWSVPPAEAVEDALRRWLAASGLFAAVLAPGSRLPPDLVLEGELDALVAQPGAGRLHAALGFVVVRQQGTQTRAVVQRTVTADAPLVGAGADPGAAAVARAGNVALAGLLAQVEAALTPLASGGASG